MNQSLENDTYYSISISDTVNSEFDVFKLILLNSSKYTLSPELYNLIGKDIFLKLLDVYGGTVVEFPSRKDLESSVREVEIYTKMKKAKESSDRKGAYRIGKQYSITTDRVRQIYTKIERLIQESKEGKAL